MGRITPQEIQELSEPMEAVYQDIVDQLLINIGKHLQSNTGTWTAYWETEKLAEMGQLTKENAAIINQHIKDMPQVLRDTMEESRKKALAGLENQLAKAAADGYITPAIEDSTVTVLRNQLNQAEDRLNLTNTVMMRSSVDMYQQAVQMTEERALELQRKGELIEGKETAAVATGAITRQQAVRDTIQRLSDEGLTGFYDRAGRSWSPEAYVNMVVRTTVHNVAIEATQARMQDYGTQVIQISSHAGARPLCYPYQGKFYSWDGSAGKIELGNGKVVSYEPLSSTSYGQPAGLFGVNCGHYPIPVIPGVTIPHGADDIEPAEANNKNYAESQQQRELERRVRRAKRVVEMEGDLATDAERQKIRDAQAAVREFCDRTGRARRYDRETVYPAKSTNKMAAGPSNDWSGTSARFVTKQERTAIRQYADEKGVNIGNISSFDGDSSLLKEEIDVLSRLQSELPLKKKVILNVGRMSGDDFAETEREVITINSNALRNRDETNKNIQDGGLFASSDVSDIVAHEYGHVYTHFHGNNGLELAGKAYYTVFGEQLESEALLKWLKSNLSEYAVTESKQGYLTEIVPEMLAKDNSSRDKVTEEFVRLLKEGLT